MLKMGGGKKCCAVWNFLLIFALKINDMNNIAMSSRQGMATRSLLNCENKDASLCSA